jgi:hypothetical protein
MITRLLDKQSHLNDMLSAKTAKSGGKQTVGVSVKQQQFQWKHVEAQNPMDHVGSYGMNHPQQEKLISTRWMSEFTQQQRWNLTKSPNIWIYLDGRFFELLKDNCSKVGPTPMWTCSHFFRRGM